MRPPATVYLVDDDPAILKALERLIRAAGYRIKTYERASDFLDSPLLKGPQCLVLDLQMPGLSGLDLQRELSRRGLKLPIVFLSGQGDIPKSVQAMKAGALDFLTKPVPDRRLLEAIRAATDRDKERLKADRERESVRARIRTLSPREREVFRWVISGSLNKQTAFALGIVEKTVKYHRAQVMRKMGVDSVAELALLAERAGVKPMKRRT